MYGRGVVSFFWWGMGDESPNLVVIFMAKLQKGLLLPFHGCNGHVQDLLCLAFVGKEDVQHRDRR